MGDDLAEAMESSNKQKRNLPVCTGKIFRNKDTSERKALKPQVRTLQTSPRRPGDEQKASGNPLLQSTSSWLRS